MENRIFIEDQNGAVKAELSGSGEVVLAWEGEYVPGDTIVKEFSRPGYYMIRVDDCVDDALIYMTDTRLRYPIVFGEKRTVTTQRPS